MWFLLSHSECSLLSPGTWNSLFPQHYSSYFNHSFIKSPPFLVLFWFISKPVSWAHLFILPIISSRLLAITVMSSVSVIFTTFCTVVPPVPHYPISKLKYVHYKFIIRCIIISWFIIAPSGAILKSVADNLPPCLTSICILYLYLE